MSSDSCVGGGNGWTGATTCVSGYTCTKGNDFYSQCLPGGAAPNPTTTLKTSTSKPASTATAAPNPQVTVINGGASGSGKTTRYWDCCKASCSWPGKGSVKPVNTCDKNNNFLSDPAVSPARRPAPPR